MKRTIGETFLLTAAILFFGARQALGTEWYTAASGAWLMPGNGFAAEACGGVQMRGGVYLSDDWALEVEGGWYPNLVCDAGGNAPLFSAAARGVWHVMGYERFDPFLTFGGVAFLGEKDVFDDGRRPTGLGPEFGAGAFYHLTNNWSLRAEARAAALLDDTCAMAYSVGIGLQYGFGGDEE